MNKIILVIPATYTPESKDCPICNLAFYTKADVFNYRQWGCCRTCDLKYRYPNKEKWNKGWRPENKTSIEDN